MSFAGKTPANYGLQETGGRARFLSAEGAAHGRTPLTLAVRREAFRMTLTIDTILQFITLVVMVMLGLLLKSYLPSYLTKKGENLATKEDIEEITSKVERIRSQHASELEALRSRLQSESEVFSRRRAVYDGMVQSLGTFVSDRQATEEAKARFLDDYASMWLWADDQVLRSLNEFLEVNIVYAASRNQSLQPLLRHAYAACVIGM